jgi:hypothetical protein
MAVIELFFSTTEAQRKVRGTWMEFFNLVLTFQKAKTSLPVFSLFSLSGWFKNNSITGIFTLIIFHFQVASLYKAKTKS